MSVTDKGHILFVGGSLSVGGAESQFAMLAKGLKARGWMVDVFLLEKTGLLIEPLRQAGVPMRDGGYRTAGNKIGKMISICLCQVRILRCLLWSRPDVVHAFLPIPNFMGAIAGRMAFVPLVITSKRALGRYQDRDPEFRWLDRIANALSHVITANSRAVARDAQARDGCDISRIVVIPNGLDFSRFDEARHRRNDTRDELGLSSADVAIAMVANLIPYKGHRELIEAFARVAAHDDRLKLFLIGRDQGILQGLVDDARRFGVSDRINLMGERGDVPTLLSAMDIGVMASHEEGFSNALLEKLAAGLPVVATDVGGNPEAVEGLPDCILVRPHDVDDLAKGLTAAIGGLGADDRNRKIRQRRVRERYSVDAMVDAYEHLYLHTR